MDICTSYCPAKSIMRNLKMEKTFMLKKIAQTPLSKINDPYLHETVQVGLVGGAGFYHMKQSGMLLSFRVIHQGYSSLLRCSRCSSRCLYSIDSRGSLKDLGILLNHPRVSQATGQILANFCYQFSLCEEGNKLKSGA